MLSLQSPSLLEKLTASLKGTKVLVNPENIDVDLNKVWAFDIETDEKDNFVGFGLYCGEDSAYYFTDLKFFDNRLKLVGHNIKSDLHWLKKWNVSFNFDNVVCDTILASFVLNPTREKHGLKTLSKELLNNSYPSYKDIVGRGGKNRQTLDKQPLDIASTYNANDVVATYNLYKYFNSRLTVQQKALLNNIELPLMRLLFKMEELGIRVDTKYLKHLKEMFDRDISKSLDFLGNETNFNSPKQVKEWLLGLGIKLESTDKKFLTQLVHPKVKELLNYRELCKLQSTYVEPLMNQERVHTEFNQLITTGRLSSRNPNLQNIPTKTERGNLLRKVFIPKTDHVFIDADFSQIEYRLLAHYTQEPVLLEAYKKGADIHAETASLLGVGRYVGKTLNFACVTTDTKILTANFLWKNAEDLEEGEQLWAFDENQKPTSGRKGARHWKPSIVTHNHIEPKICIKLKLSNNEEIKCSLEHPLIVKTSHERSVWKQASNIKIGDTIPKYLKRYDYSNTWMQGWLGGFADGEGWCDTSFIGLSQNVGPVLDRAKMFLNLLGFVYSETLSGSSPCHNLRIKGGYNQVVRFLSICQPLRLLTKFKKFFPMMGAIEYPKVIEIEELGLQNVACLSTSTKTYITEGYASHNSIYGAQAKKIAQTVNQNSEEKITQEQAQSFLDTYWRKLPRVKYWIERTKEEARSKKAYRTLSGQYFPLTEINSSDRLIRWHCERQAVNGTIQGSAAYIIKLAMLELEQNDYLPVLQVHDELIFEFHKDDDLNVITFNIKGYMEDVVKLSVPLIVDIGMGNNWQEAKK